MPAVAEAVVNVAKKRKLYPPMCIKKLQKELVEDIEKLDHFECILEADSQFPKDNEALDLVVPIQFLITACTLVAFTSKLIDKCLENAEHLAKAREVVEYIHRTGVYDFLNCRET